MDTISYHHRAHLSLKKTNPHRLTNKTTAAVDSTCGGDGDGDGDGNGDSDNDNVSDGDNDEDYVESTTTLRSLLRCVHERRKKIKSCFLL